MAHNSVDVVRVEASNSGLCPLQFCVLGDWDDLSGPGVKAVFPVEHDFSVDIEKAQYLSKIALSFHLNDPQKVNFFAVCEFFDMNLSGFNCVYSALKNGHNWMYCFFCVFPRNYYCVLKNMTSTFSAFWEEKIDRLKVFHSSRPLSSSDVIDHYRSSFIPEFCDLLAQLERSRTLIEQLPSKKYFSSIDFNDKFVQRCITSHLITFGRSLVIGTPEDVERINRMIYILRLFSFPLQKTLCIFLPSDAPQQSFHAEFMVQGLIKQPSDKLRRPIGIWDLLKGRYPLTIINVRKKKVTQSVPLLSHVSRRKAFLTASVNAFLKGNADGTPMDTSLLFTCVKEVKFDGLISDDNVISRGVEELCSEVMSFKGSADLIMNFINIFMRQIIVRAKMLIAYASEMGVSNASVISGSLKNLRKVLNASVDDDFMILLAFAEQLKPGTYRALENYF